MILKQYKSLLLILCFVCSLYQSDGQKISGVTVVAPPDPIGHSAIERVKKTNAEWACFVPYGFHRKGKTDLKFNIDWQWWGEREEGLNKCIAIAKENNMHVLLKPQVYIPGGWVGELDYNSEKEWKEWEANYEKFIDFFLEIAINHEVEMFCIGTEYKIAIQKREAFWRQLIQKVRSKYKGEIVYSSNWDAYENVPFWDALDYIGVSAYFPLTDHTTPSIKTLESKWNPIVKKLGNYSKKKGKKVVFTEYGYLTIDKCAHRAWELEKKVKSSSINQNAQANAFAALYKSLWDKDWWAGGFIWKWFPDGMGHEGYFDRDYTPQGKKAEEVIKVYYQEMNRINSDSQ